MKIYRKFNKNNKLVQTARVIPFPIGKYGFETSLFGTKPYELNMNMPLFKTETESVKWIESNGEWE